MYFQLYLDIYKTKLIIVIKLIMIDDVEYLAENVEKDSQIVYIDSTLRDKYFYPNANEYVVNFEQPFKLVYGFDVLDATIPVTMYNVDAYNKTICFTVVMKNQLSLSPIDPKFHFSEISTCVSFTELFNRDEETFVLVGSEANLNQYLGSVTTPNKNYVMYYRTLINTTEIVLRSSNQTDEFLFFKHNTIEYGIKKIPANQDLVDIIESGEFGLNINTDNTIDVVKFDKNIIDAIAYNAAKTANAYLINISNYHKSLEVGNYDVISIVNDLNDLINPIFIDVAATTPVPKKQAKLQFTSSHFILINNVNGDLVKSLGFDTTPFLTATSTSYEGWTIGSNYLVFGGVYDSPTSKYKIVSPGLISLLGERFAILRIKELEDHLYGSYAYMSMTPGIGMFKMASAFGGITNLRFDYTTVIKKPFHPIGKLAKLSIRFETASGKLYDFKGVNHQLLVNIKFYAPTQKMKFTKSILNPNYDPNIMNYMAKNRTIANREQSEDDQDYDNDDEYLQYKKELDKYDYSSSEGDPEDDNDEEESDEESEQDAYEYMQRNRMMFYDPQET